MTGHKFVAVDYSDRDYKKDIRRKLGKNIAFFEDNPIGVVIQLIGNRGYNEPTGKFNDAIIVSIPKNELNENKDGIIIERDGVKYLNPKYIKGFVRINVEKGTIEKFVENSPEKYYVESTNSNMPNEGYRENEEIFSEQDDEGR